MSSSILSSVEQPEKTSETEKALDQCNKDISLQPEIVILGLLSAAVIFTGFAMLSGEWSIFTMVGYCLFMLFYPVLKEKFQSGKKEFFSLLAICTISCIAFYHLVTSPDHYVEVVTIIMALVGIKLVFYPNYNFDE